MLELSGLAKQQRVDEKPHRQYIGDTSTLCRGTSREETRKSNTNGSVRAESLADRGSLKTQAVNQAAAIEAAGASRTDLRVNSCPLE